MAAPISVIIPTLNAAASLPGAFASLMEGVEAGLVREVIVTDGGSDDDTAMIAETVGARVVTAPPSRGGQLRRGCAQAQGDWLLVLHADTQLAAGWTDAVKAAMADREVAYWGYLQFDQGGRAVAAWANLRSKVLGLPYGDQSLFLSQRLYAQVGGYPDQPIMEDVALARALRGRLQPAGHVAVTSSAKYRAQGWVTRGARNLILLARYFLGADPRDLAKAYARAGRRDASKSA